MNGTTTSRSEDKTLRRIYIGHANTFHDPSIAIIEGDQIFAEGIERHIQCKRAWENLRLWYSWRAVRKALNDLGLWPVKDADVVSVTSWDYDLLKEVVENRLVEFDGPGGVCMLSHHMEMEPIFNNQLAWILRSYPANFSDQPHELAPEMFQDSHNISIQIKMTNHHLAHAATAVYTSPFDECMVMIIDGYGEWTTNSFYHFHDNRFDLIHQQGIHSLGLMYSSITEICGFSSLEGEEWKIMGLAAYGAFNNDIYQFFNERIVFDGLSFEIIYDPEIYFKTLMSLIGGMRHPDDPDVMKIADLAHCFQRFFEETVVKLAKAAGDLCLSKNLAYAGGCALNSSANGKILENTNFERLHIPSAPADDGCSLGAAFYEKYAAQKDGNRSVAVMSPYLGSMIDIERLEKILSFKGIKYRHLSDENELCEEVAILLDAGNIVGWIQGRAEFGPRALGNRSIIADPRPADMKDRINSRVKFREDYRPLAPSILHEFGDEYFEGYQESPYMERTLNFRDAVKDKVPAVVHKNGTGRLQTVREEWNPRYYRLIHAFYEKTGIPLVLNTSYNVMGKPIAHSVEDAITVFFTTGLDYLVIGNYILMKG
ncbi:MAG TPA: nodulation protein nolNO [Deltaproteobacteria bacterium]|nr:nodulation protein nolNO [Deltaproteobacteria bacterium]